MGIMWYSFLYLTSKDQSLLALCFLKYSYFALSSTIQSVVLIYVWVVCWNVSLTTFDTFVEGSMCASYQLGGHNEPLHTEIT
jgi:hypothetical protein